MTIKKTWLVLDSPFLCYRSFYTTGGLSHGDNPTGVIFGFLQAILTLQEDHGSNNFVFCFDSRKSLREQQHVEYKRARREKEASRSEEEKEALAGLRKQMRLLRRETLLQLGYRNILCQKGREADDLIAKVCESIPTSDKIIIVSGDQDLYQLLAKNTILWNPIKKTPYTLKHLKSEYGLTPTEWCSVKALSGCKSDGVAGIKGVGEKTAARYLLGKLNPKQKTYEKIVNGQDIYNRNLPLVKLPYPGTKIPILQNDEVTTNKWRTVLESFGMLSMLKRVMV